MSSRGLNRPCVLLLRLFREGALSAGQSQVVEYLLNHSDAWRKAMKGIANEPPRVGVDSVKEETTESCNYDSIRIQDGPEFANTSHRSVEKVKNEK